MKKNRYIVWPVKITFLVLVLLTLSSKQASTDPLEITTSVGIVVGSSKDKVVTFLGIPYAEPFSGDLRWRRPVAKIKMSTPFTADRLGSTCPHMDSLTKEKMFSRSFSGDTNCLNLNIWTPEPLFLNRSKEQIPVMVFVPGGGFQMGSSSWAPLGLPVYDGAKLAELGNVIVVTINYRAGSTGFFYDTDLAKREPEVGNLGLLDQIEAFKWVKKNIAAFGGDEGNITAFGSSSGAMSLCNLLTHTDIKGLIHKAILQSGSCWLSTKEHGLETSRNILNQTKCGGIAEHEKRLACILETPQNILSELEPEMDYKKPTFENFHFSPVFDGAFFKELPGDVIKARRHYAVPILMGSNELEIPPFMMDNSKEAWNSLFTSWDADKNLKKIVRNFYEKKFPDYESRLSKLKTDYLYTCRIRYFAELLADHQEPPVYLYHFKKNIMGIVDNWIKGSFHGMELFYIFQKVPPYRWLPGVPEHIDFQKEMGTLWTQFARTGSVESSDRKDWKPYSSKSRSVGVLGDDDKVVQGLGEDICNTLEKIMGKNQANVSLFDD